MLQQTQNFVFIGGLHRSGTTLLADLLARHPEASGLSDTRISCDEGQFLQTALPRDAELGGAGRFAFDPRAQQAPFTDPAAAFALRNQLLQSWRPYWDNSKRFLLEKTPGNCLNARMLQSVFGDQARFVFITRHPIANALATRKWSRTSLFALITHWLQAQEQMRNQLSELRNVAWITYENLVADPAGTIAQLQAFLGMAPAPAGASRLQDLNKPYLESWNRLYAARITELPDAVIRGELPVISRGRRAVWHVRSQLRRRLLRRGVDLLSTGPEAAAVVTHYEDRVRSFGYSLVDVSARPPIARLIAPGRMSSFSLRVERRRQRDAEREDLARAG